MKTNRSVRFDQEDLRKCEYLDIDINSVCRESIKQTIEEKEETISFVGRKCSNCGKYITEKDVVRLVNEVTDKFGIHKIGKNKKAICFNHVECGTSMYKFIKESL